MTFNEQYLGYPSYTQRSTMGYVQLIENVAHTLAYRPLNWGVVRDQLHYLDVWLIQIKVRTWEANDWDWRWNDTSGS